MRVSTASIAEQTKQKIENRKFSNRNSEQTKKEKNE